MRSFVLLLALTLPGCFVDQRDCLADDDCAAGQLCQSGECRTSGEPAAACVRDSECAADERCVAGRCAFADGCLGCAGRYFHAESVCEHGDCRLVRCEDNHHDLDQSSANGCEYACTPRGDERCNSLDDDCDGQTDEGFDLSADPQNCALCGHVCALPQATARCEASRCVVGECSPGAVDLDGQPQNGCEYACAATGDESCDGRDNDCDGLTDEGFDRRVDPQNCATCGHVCPTPPQAIPLCVEAQCDFACQPGHFDNDGDPANGCEADACQPTAGGIEICDLRDNDCDGEVDEGIPHDLPTSCGPRCAVCPALPFAAPGCVEGACGLGPCEPGQVDLNGLPEDGCEYACAATGAETCNGQDDDCDGQVDEGFDLSADPEHCGTCETRCAFDHAEARCVDFQCVPGVCETGYLDLDGQPGCEYACTATGPETCNGQDDDCDGRVDNGGVCGVVCPEDMVRVEALYCVDRYEAARPDATANSAGTDNSRATSRAGVMPWFVSGAPDTARAACAAAGKRLCTAAEWTRACRGPADTEYSYGDTYDATACNGIDAFCPGEPYPHCRDALPETAFHAVPTGSFPRCTNGYGVFDINGNYWEYTDSVAPTGRGGAFNCGNSELLHRCGELPEGGSGRHIGDWGPSAIGFRCCSDGAPEVNP